MMTAYYFVGLSIFPLVVIIGPAFDFNWNFVASDLYSGFACYLIKPIQIIASKQTGSWSCGHNFGVNCYIFNLVNFRCRWVEL